MVILDGEGRVVAGNDSWRRCVLAASGGIDDSAVGQRYLSLDFLRPVRADYPAYRAGFEELLRGSASELNLAVRVRTMVGKQHFRVHAARFARPDGVQLVVMREDISDLREARLDLAALAGRLVDVQERERARYAEELHDSTAQHLAAASLNVMVLKERAGREGWDMDAVIAELERSISESLREIRSISYLLHPRTLDRDGLSATLIRFATGFSTRTGIAVRSAVANDIERLPTVVQRAVLRIAQEALTNVHRHASADAVELRASMHGDALALSIRDNGHGFGRAVGSEVVAGVGIAGMEARAHRFGGSLRVSSDSSGTTVVLRIPLRGRAKGLGAKLRPTSANRSRRHRAAPRPIQGDLALF
ncbi:sensor histidine kinase [Bradyrhizobium sp. AC87j1]|uniref:sensor histidine kinase n=1 Tax=Bradyrhizobium sp. AC87j1 TaxID=2055894 RepID=UPI001374D73A|nr:sensor histidine kinase [Bradyrhizobium sp. AC87j1]